MDGARFVPEAGVVPDAPARVSMSICCLRGTCTGRAIESGGIIWEVPVNFNIIV